MVNSKHKGNRGENLFATFLQQHGFKAYKNSSSGGNHNKSDIHNNLDINFEVKTIKKINLLKAWKQTDRDSSLARSMPMLAIHFDGMREMEWLMVMHSEDFMDMLKKSRTAQKITVPLNEVTTQETRDRNYALQNLKSALSKAMKYL